MADGSETAESESADQNEAHNGAHTIDEAGSAPAPFKLPELPESTAIVVALVFAYVVLRWVKGRDASARFDILRNRDGDGEDEALCKSLEAAAPVAEAAYSRVFVRACAGVLLVVAVAALYAGEGVGFDPIKWGALLILVLTFVCSVNVIQRLWMGMAAGFSGAGSRYGVLAEYLDGLDHVRKNQYAALEKNIRDQLEADNAKL